MINFGWTVTYLGSSSVNEPANIIEGFDNPEGTLSKSGKFVVKSVVGGEERVWWVQICWVNSVGA